MSSTERGRVAEKLAANYLVQRGHQILVQNWRNRYAELDIITRKASVIHVVEVKYRLSTEHGGGLEYITPDKVIRLQNAAQIWMREQNLDSAFQIDIITVTGQLTRPVIDYLANAIII